MYTVRLLYVVTLRRSFATPGCSSACVLCVVLLRGRIVGRIVDRLAHTPPLFRLYELRIKVEYTAAGNIFLRRSWCRSWCISLCKCCCWCWYAFSSYRQPIYVRQAGQIRHSRSTRTRLRIWWTRTGWSSHTRWPLLNTNTRTTSTATGNISRSEITSVALWIRSVLRGRCSTWEAKSTTT